MITLNRSFDEMHWSELDALDPDQAELEAMEREERRLDEHFDSQLEDE